jgi:hypothetical protein
MRVNLVGQTTRVFAQKGLQNIHDSCKIIGELNFGPSAKQRHGYKHSRTNHQVYRLRFLREKT